MAMFFRYAPSTSPNAGRFDLPTCWPLAGSVSSSMLLLFVTTVKGSMNGLFSLRFRYRILRMLGLTFYLLRTLMSRPALAVFLLGCLGLRLNSGRCNWRLMQIFLVLSLVHSIFISSNSWLLLFFSNRYLAVFDLSSNYNFQFCYMLAICKKDQKVLMILLKFEFEHFWLKIKQAIRRVFLVVHTVEMLPI